MGRMALALNFPANIIISVLSAEMQSDLKDSKTGTAHRVLIYQLNSAVDGPIFNK
jgi:hypothetical protein